MKGLLRALVLQIALTIMLAMTMAGLRGQSSSLGKPSCKKSAVFFNIVQKAFDPPPFRLNIMW